MSDDKPNVSEKASEIAKNIWLAGLGAYGKVIDEAQDRLDKATREPPRLFKDLVKKGEKLEDEVRDSLSSMQKTGASSVEERIRRVRENFNNFYLGYRSDELAEIGAKLDALTEKVDALAKALDKPARKSSPARRSAPRKKKS